MCGVWGGGNGGTMLDENVHFGVRGDVGMLYVSNPIFSINHSASKQNKDCNVY